MAWTNVTDKLPTETKKYLVIIDCDGKQKESYCTFKLKVGRFHFDMQHINWRVVAWLYAPLYLKKVQILTLWNLKNTNT